MMKKLSLVLIAISIFLYPYGNAKAITLKQYEDQVRKYEKEVKDAKDAVRKTEGQINATKNEITSLKNEVHSLDEEIEAMHKQSDDAKGEIKDKSLEIKEYYAYLQLSNGENEYLEYAFGAESVTDFIYRMSIVEQMTEYNKEVIKDLEDLVERNIKREEEIKKKEKVLEEKQKTLGNKVVSLGEQKESIEDGGIDSAKQLKIYQEIVASYKKKGCKSSDVIGVDCAVDKDAGKFRRPTKKGSITSNFGSRWGSFHRGVDITSSNRKNEKIYPIANGTISAKYTDGYGALILIIEHYDSIDNKWYTSLYAHLSKYASGLSVGKYVTSDQYIGYMGNTGYVVPKPTASNPNAGTHLHLEVGPCRIYKDSNCSTWSKYTAYIKKQANKGFKGPKQLINLPNSWSTR